MRRVGTARLHVAAIAAAGGSLLAIITGVVEVAVLVAPWAVLLVLGGSRSARRSAHASIAVPNDRLVAGDAVDVSAELRCSDGWLRAELVPTAGFWLDHDRADTAALVRTDAVGATGTTSLAWSFPAASWGAHDVGRIRVGLTEPYGLLRWEAMLSDPTPLRVHPRPRELHTLLRPRLFRRVAGSHTSPLADRGVEYADLRQFTAGDSPRDINWRVAARTGDLWVSQRHADRATDVVILLDSFVEPGRDMRTSVSLGIEVALAVTDGHLTRVDRVGLIDLGGIVRWVSPRTGRHQLQRLTDALLATVPYDNAAPKDLGVIPPRGLPPRSFVIAISPLLDARFIQALHGLAARGHDVAVVELSPEDDGPPDATPSAVVARRLWEALRQITRDELAGHGVAVARWNRGEPLAAVFSQLARSRRRAGRIGAR